MERAVPLKNRLLRVDGSLIIADSYSKPYLKEKP
jgi:hypothetical protein